jgi:mevalonate kinase
MPAFSATAPGKIILFGEHAVVYGRPAIAAPVFQVRARAVVSAQPRGQPGEVRILAPDIQLDCALKDLPRQHPLSAAIWGVAGALGISNLPACTIRISATIPLAAGLGSGAAVSVALIRALAAFCGHPLEDAQVSALAYEVEKIHHGTPSGIDNTVITYAKPVYFTRGQPIELFHAAQPFTIVIGDTGISSPTAVAVGDLRQAWTADPSRYEALFDAVGEIARQARAGMEAGEPGALGPLMDRNQALLQQMGVSSPELDRLAEAARGAGALGAKLSGGGRGGNMIALVTPDAVPNVVAALESAGAVRTIVTTVK